MGAVEKDSRLEEILDMERLQSFQDNLAKALGMAFVTVDYRGRPVLKSSGFTDFCSGMLGHERYCHLCSQCHAHGGLRATMTGQACIYRCHSGLVEFALPLMVDGKYLGAVLGGQCEVSENASSVELLLPHLTPWEEDSGLAGLRGGVHKTTCAKLEAGVRLAEEYLRLMLQEEQCRRIQEALQQKNRELMEEKAARINLEMAGREEDESGKFVERLDSEHLFYMLNVISRLAFLEEARETERTACDFAAMMRYVMENGEYNCVTLGEELEYIDYYLQIQRRRMDGRLRYEIHVPEKYHGTLCPFMMLHPLVKCVVKYILDSSLEGGTLLLNAVKERELLVLSLCCDCTILTGSMLDLEGKRQGSTLSRMDQSLKNIFGSSCGITAGSRSDGQLGTQIQVRLPLQGRNLEK